MSISVTSIVLSVAYVAILTWAWRALNWVWFRPKKIERCLRQQGLAGKPYRPLIGDWMENSAMVKEAKSKPIGLSDDIGPRIIPFVLETVKNYGKNSLIWMGPNPRVNIMDPDQIKDVFMKINDYQKFILPLMKPMLCGLGSHKGEKWAKHRKIINPAFHQEKLKLMIPAISQSCSDMIKKWEQLASMEGSCELDVWLYLQNLTCDVIARTAFGSNYEEGKRIFDLLKELSSVTVDLFQTPAFIPGWRFLPTKANKRQKAIDEEIQASLKVIINKREKVHIVGEAANDDLLGLLLESNFREIQEHGKIENAGMTNQDVIDECKLFYFAGQETTSSLLVWTMFLLCQYPNWQTHAREEVFQVFGKKNPEFDGLNHLKVVTMILYEVLRLYPPVVHFVRCVHEETKLGDLSLPAGVQITLSTILIHRDKELWGDDAFEFKPERFAEGVSKATKSQVGFLPFGWGPRICIGQNFALIEAKLALAKILQHFSFDLSPSYIHAPRTIITLQPQYGAPMILHKL